MAIKRYLFVSLLLLAQINSAQSMADARRVDFKNYSYPWPRSSGWPGQMKWLDTSVHKHVRLVNGSWRIDSHDNYPAFSGLTFEAVQYADVTGDGQPEAIVVLRFDTGGTQYSHYVYIYSSDQNPKLLAYFHSGDRSSFGLYRVYGQSGKLVVELFDPKKSSGDCCSSRYIRTRYRWREGKFEAFGPEQFGVPGAPSRLPVTVFGIHK